MKILAVDTSTASGSIALLNDMQIEAEWTLRSSETHNRRLLKTVDHILHEVGWELNEIGGLAVTTGPGSFTGVRIGLTTVKTLAWSLKVPFVGVPSLDALAAPLSFAGLPVCTVLDARKQEVYFAIFRPEGKGVQSRQGPYHVASPAAVRKEIDGPTILCGDGWLLYRDLLLKDLGSLAIEAPAPYHTIRAGFVGELARARILAGETDNPMTSAPLYVRPSEAELHHLDPAFNRHHS